jgi:hypothetical protein
VPPPAVEMPEAPVAEAPASSPAVEAPAAPLVTPAPANPVRTPTVAAAPSTAVFPSRKIRPMSKEGDRERRIFRRTTRSASFA